MHSKTSNFDFVYVKDHIPLMQNKCSVVDLQIYEPKDYGIVNTEHEES